MKMVNEILILSSVRYTRYTHGTILYRAFDNLENMIMMNCDKNLNRSFTYKMTVKFKAKKKKSDNKL